MLRVAFEDGWYGAWFQQSLFSTRSLLEITWREMVTTQRVILCRYPISAIRLFSSDSSYPQAQASLIFHGKSK
jgi:hypothetical protein